MFVVILHRKRKAKTTSTPKRYHNTYHGDVILTAQRSTPSTLVALRARLDSTHSWPCSGAAENFSASVASQVP